MFEYVLTNTQYYQDIADAIRRKKAEVDKKLVSIAITTPPTKTSYKATEEVSYSGLVVTATYDNNITENVTSKCNFNLASGSKITNDTTVRITYKYNDISKTVTFDLTAIKLQSLAITSQPAKVDYSSGETMSLSGLVVTATWSDGTTGNVTNNCSYSYPSGTLMTTDGVNTHSKNYNNIIYYTEGNITKQVNYGGLIKSILISLAITTQPTKTSYALGEYFSENGMVVEATFNNYTTGVAYDCNERNTRFTSTGTKTITVSYTWNGVTKTATTSVTVGAKALRGIAITTRPTKTTYTQGENLSLSGMVVTATYTDDSTGTVTGWTASPANGSTLSEIGTKTITISYTTGGVTKTTTTTVTVEAGAATLERIAVTKMPNQTDYTLYAENTKLDGTSGTSYSHYGSVVMAYYSDRTSKELEYTPYNNTGYKYSPKYFSSPNQSVTISYTEGGITKTATVNVNLSWATAASIDVTTNYMPQHTVGDALDLSKMRVNVAYNGGGVSTAFINSQNNYPYSITTSPVNGTILTTAGNLPITVNFTSPSGNHSETVNITVNSA